ncbi:piggyBac transposable element-derived protein 4-like [Metopolophium dirhodum]|uniref:piggyBac transposable element-derived protein 4-like n=1 Tax=Metopolophium dirhodum TaxID=44670 RepID=UPI00298FA846|nr:piggyBac transposable element-derived protein 4-like [Metopolophium dirhodum]
MASSSRPKRQRINDCINDDEIVNELFCDELSDFSDFSEIDDSDADRDYFPSESENSVVDSTNIGNNQDFNIENNHNTSSTVWFDVSGTYQKPLIFNKTPGFKIDIPDNASALNYFKLFCSTDIFELMVVETNRNAEQFLSKSRLTKSSRFSKWSPTNVDEIEKFMGLLLWFGLVQMPSLESYWSTKIRYKNNVAPKIMSQNRFELLLRFWHFADNEETPDNDRIYKVRDLLERVVKNYQNVMEPDEYLAIDESMVPFRGRLKFKQYIPGKAHKYGVKLFKICEKNGYTHDLQVYAGKNQVDGKGLALRVVMELIRPYLNVGRTVVTDNFYTSMPLARELLKNNTHLVGTLRTNRVKLPEVLKTKLKKGQIIGKESTDGVVVAKWHDKRDVAMLSTKHGIEMIDTGKKNRNDEPQKQKRCLHCYSHKTTVLGSKSAALATKKNRHVLLYAIVLFKNALS